MKNNIILKGMFLLAALCAITSVSAKRTTRGTAPVEQPKSRVIQSGGGPKPLVEQPVEAAQVQISALANDILARSEKNKWTSKDLNNVLQETKGLTEADTKAIQKEIERLSKIEKKLGRAEASLDKDKLITSLQSQLAEQRKLLTKLLEGKAPVVQRAGTGISTNLFNYESFLSKYISPEAVAGAGVAGAAASIALLGAGTTAVIALPVAGAVYGFDRLASWLTTGAKDWPTKVKATALYLGQQLTDLGKYPTVQSKIMGITEEDFINTADIEKRLYDEAISQLSKLTKEEGDKTFEAVTGEEAKQEKINELIARLRVKYDYGSDGLETYKKMLEDKENIDQCRAVVSEYLRAASKLLWRQQLKNKEAQKEEAEQAKKAVPAQPAPPAAQPEGGQQQKSLLERLKSIKIRGG